MSTIYTHLINDSNANPGDKFKNCVISLCEGHPSVDSQKTARRVSKAGILVISAGAKIPFAPVSMRLGPVLGPPCAAANCVGFLVLEYWAAAGAVDDFWGPKTGSEIELLEKGKTHKAKVVGVITTASLVALSSQLPIALAGAEYNAPKYKLVAALVLLVAGAFIPMRSIQLSIEQIRLSLQKSTEAEIAKIKGKMISLIKEAQSEFIEKRYYQKISFVEGCNEARSASAAEKADKYLMALLKKGDILPLSSIKKGVRAVCNYTGTGVGIGLAGLFEYAMGEYTFALAKNELWDDDVSSGIIAGLAVGSTTYLYGRSIIYTSQRIFNLIGNFLTGGEVRNLGWQLRPKLSFALTSIGLVVDLLSIGASYVMWNDFYANNEAEKQIFRNANCVSMFLILFTSTLDIVDDIVAYTIQKGSDEERDILKINSEFQRLAWLIEKSPAQEFIDYLTNQDESVKNELLKRMDVSAEQLSKYSKAIEYVEIV